MLPWVFGIPFSFYQGRCYSFAGSLHRSGSHRLPRSCLRPTICPRPGTASIRSDPKCRRFQRCVGITVLQAVPTTTPSCSRSIFAANVLSVASAFAGNLRTSDFDGPYNISLLSTQYSEIKGESAAQLFPHLSLDHRSDVRPSHSACSRNCRQAELLRPGHRPLLDQRRVPRGSV